MRLFKPKLMFVTFFGTLLAWLEFASFAYLANIVSILYFPGNNLFASHLGHITYLVTAFIAPLIGSVIFGYIGDFHGRKIALSVSIFLMGIASLTISFLPTYQQVGILASLMLLFCRIAQGVALAGEFNGACIFLMEHSSKKLVHIASAMPVVAAGAGLLLGYMYADAINHTAFLNWGWRIPFLLSAACCLLFSYFRLATKESPAFIKAVQRTRIVKNPLKAIIKKHKVALAEGLLLSSFIILYTSICGLYYFHYLLAHASLSYLKVVTLTLIGNASLLVLIPVFAYVADVIGRQTLLTIGIVGAAISAPLMFMLASSGSIVILSFSELFYAIFAASAFAPIFGILGRLFPSPVRYTGLSLSWSISFALFAGGMPYLISYIAHHHHAMLPAITASASAFITLAVVLFPKTKPYPVALNHFAIDQ